MDVLLNEKTNKSRIISFLLAVMVMFMCIPPLEIGAILAQPNNYSIKVSLDLISTRINTEPEFYVGLYTKDDGNYSLVNNQVKKVSAEEDAAFANLNTNTEYYVFECDEDGNNPVTLENGNDTITVDDDEQGSVTFRVSYYNNPITFTDDSEGVQYVTIVNKDTYDEKHEVTVNNTVSIDLTSEQYENFSSQTFTFGIYTYDTIFGDYPVVDTKTVTITKDDLQVTPTIGNYTTYVATKSVTFSKLAEDVYYIFELNDKTQLQSSDELTIGDNTYVVDYVTSNVKVVDGNTVPADVKVTNTSTHGVDITLNSKDTNGNAFSGIILEITKDDNNFKETWNTSSNTTLTLNSLYAGSYTITGEVKNYTPINITFTIGDDGNIESVASNNGDEYEWTYKWDKENNTLDIITAPIIWVNVKDSTENKDLSGAKIQITPVESAESYDLSKVVVTQDDEVISETSTNSEVEFTSISSEPIKISGLPDGNYTLTETAPDGYNSPNNFYFTIENGTITTTSTGNYTVNGNNITIKNTAKTTFEVSVTNGNGSKALSGAVIQITPANNNKSYDLSNVVVTQEDGTVVENSTATTQLVEFTSNGTAFTVSGLPNGCYTMTETAPNGYSESNTVTFNVNDGTISESNADNYRIEKNGICFIHTPVNNISVSIMDMDKVKTLSGAIISIKMKYATCLGETGRIDDTTANLNNIIVKRGDITLTQDGELDSNDSLQYTISGENEIQFYSCGNTEIYGLPDGVYTMTETSSLDGYEKVTDSITFTIENGEIISTYYNDADYTSNRYYNVDTKNNCITMLAMPTNYVSVIVEDMNEVFSRDNLNGALLEITPSGETASICGENIVLYRNENFLTQKEMLNTYDYDVYTISNNTIQFYSDSENTRISGLPDGDYTLKEVSAPYGYETITSYVTFTLNDGSIRITTDDDTSNYYTLVGDTHTIEIENEISPFILTAVVDANDNTPISGALISIQSTSLNAEPDGITLNKNNVPLTKGTELTTDNYTITTGEIQFYSDSDDTRILGLPDGEYTLTETTAPNGYVKIAKNFTFTIKDGIISTYNKSDNYKVKYNRCITILNEKTTISVNVTSSTGNKNLSGAVISITNTSGQNNDLSNVVVTQDSEVISGTSTKSEVKFTSGSSETIIISGLPDGTYTLTETAPNGYKVTNSLTFTVTDGKIADKDDNEITISNEPTSTVTISSELENIALTITNASDQSIDLSNVVVTQNDSIVGTSNATTVSFTSGSSASVISGLPTGTYILTQTATLSGYQKAEPITLTVNSEGTVTSASLTDDGKIVIKSKEETTTTKATTTAPVTTTATTTKTTESTTKATTTTATVPTTTTTATTTPATTETIITTSVETSTETTTTTPVTTTTNATTTTTPVTTTTNATTTTTPVTTTTNATTTTTPVTTTTNATTTTIPVTTTTNATTTTTEVTTIETTTVTTTTEQTSAETKIETTSAITTATEEITTTTAEKTSTALDITSATTAETTITKATTSSDNVSEIAIKGDANGDEEVNAVDLLLAKKYVLQMLQQSDIVFYNADVNGDGDVNSVDILMLKKYILQIIDTLD